MNAPLKIRLGDDPLALVLSGVLPFGGYVTIQCQVFFDESASHDGAPFLCVAGLIFKKSEAIKLGREWRKVLQWKRLPYFHMVDCAHGNGVFAKLPKDERSDIARRMIEIIKCRAIQGIAVTINNLDFASVVAEFPKIGKHYGTSYAFASHSVLAGVRSWIYRNPKVQEMAYFFEDGHGSRQRTDEIMANIFADSALHKEYRYVGRGFVTKQKSYAIQAADLFAWQWYTDRRHQLEGRPRRKDCENLLQLHWNAIHLDRAAIVQIITTPPGVSKAFIASPLGKLGAQQFKGLR